MPQPEIQKPMTDFTTLAEAFFARVDHFENPAALRAKRNGRYQDIALSEVKAAVIQMAAGLQMLGVKAGDSVALISENRPEWLYSDYALALIGAVNIPVYPTLTPPLIEFILKDCGATVALVSSGAQYEKLRAIRANLPALKSVICFDPVSALGTGDGQLFDVINRGLKAGAAGEKVVREAAARVKPEDLASLVYTSGTTGQPKGVMLTHDNFVQNLIGSLQIIQLGGNDSALSLLPLCHTFERLVDYICFTQGTAISYAESVDKVRDNLLEVRPTIMAGVPRLYEKVFNGFVEKARGSLIGRLLINDAVINARALAAEALVPGAPAAGGWRRYKHKVYDALMYKKLRGNLGGNIRFFISGGAPLAKEHTLFFYGAGLPIVEGYGLSETSPVITLSPPLAIRPGSPGKPIPNVEVKIAADGEIMTRSRSVMKGYFKLPEKTAEVIKEGWFITGDVGHLDDDGYLFITDRKKDLIKTSGGKYVAPQGVEAALKHSHYIAEAAVFGDGKKYVAALLVPDFTRLTAWAREKGLPADDPAALIARTEVLAFMQTEVDAAQKDLPHHEQIKKFALLPAAFSLDAGELTPTLKVKRKAVAEKYKALIEPLFEE